MLADAPVSFFQQILEIVFRVEPDPRNVRIQADFERLVANSPCELDERLTMVGGFLEWGGALRRHAEGFQHLLDSVSVDSRLSDLDYERSRRFHSRRPRRRLSRPREVVRLAPSPEWR